MKLKEQTIEILYKTYSDDVCGYFVNLSSGQYIVLNDRLSNHKESLERLVDLSAANPKCDFVLLHSNGQIYKTENFKLPNREDDTQW